MLKDICYPVWVVPFLGFIFGYFLTYLFVQKKEIIVPSVVQKEIQDAVGILSKNGLNIRIAKEQEDFVLPAGTIIQQAPIFGSIVRINQTVFLTVSIKPTPRIAPNFLDEKIDIIKDKSNLDGFRITSVSLGNFFPRGRVVCQIPAPGEIVIGKDIIVYFADGNRQIFIFPDFKDMRLEDVEMHLNNYKAEIDVIGDSLISADKKFLLVVNQNPKPGSIVDLDKGCKIQLQVVKS
jgi:beta-lactam-binding protein with PASTA domain